MANERKIIIENKSLMEILSQLQSIPIIDTREPDVYSIGHLKSSANIPWNQFSVLTFELPPRSTPIVLIVDENADHTKIALDFLQERGTPVLRTVSVYSADWEQAQAVVGTETGSQSARLWRPCALLFDWIAKIEHSISGKLPLYAIDIACGAGRDAVFLALRGWKVMGTDSSISTLEKARILAQRESVNLNTVCVDLEPDEENADRTALLAKLSAQGKKSDNTNTDTRRKQEKENVAKLPQFRANADGTYEDIDSVIGAHLRQILELRPSLIHVARYLHRPLLPKLKTMLAPGGFIVYHTFRRGAELWGKPHRDRFLLEVDELPKFFDGFIIHHYKEGPISADDSDMRAAAFLVAQKPFDNQS